MRSILNLSLPLKTAKTIRGRAKQRGFVSTSEYIRYLLELDDNLIPADALLTMAKKADREYRAGKIKQFKSLAELL